MSNLDTTTPISEVEVVDDELLDQIVVGESKYIGGRIVKEII